jgi:hypothetical protein
LNLWNSSRMSGRWRRCCAAKPQPSSGKIHHEAREEHERGVKIIRLFALSEKILARLRFPNDLAE